MRGPLRRNRNLRRISDMSEPENDSDNQTTGLGCNGVVMPCPFCGGKKVNVIEGGTFRWRRVECQECEAMAGAVRIQTTGDGTHEEWEKAAADEAFKRWNERAGDANRKV